MKRAIRSTTSLFLLAGLLATVVITASGAESPDATLTTQSKRMDSLAATSGESTASSKISSAFSTSAGSTSNSDPLVTGLRNGTPITLTATNGQGVTSSDTFSPPTGKMGYGNVFISLALAKQQLANEGITDPTPQELQAALVGGNITTGTGQTTTLTGVLQMRSQGMGWGQIANSLGFKSGSVISGIKTANAQVSSQARVQSGSTAGRGAGNTIAPGRSETGIVTGAGAHVGGSAAAGAGGHAYGSGIVSGMGGSMSSSGAGMGAEN